MAFQFKEKYGNYIGGKFIDPVDGKYFDILLQLTAKYCVKYRALMTKISTLR